MKIVPAEYRLSKTRFTTAQDWMTYPATLFSCGNCAYTLTITMKDLARHDRSAYTNLSEHDVKLVEAANTHRSPFDMICNSFLDFYCPACTLPIRIYYVADELTASRTYVYGYELLYVIEHAANATDTINLL